MAVLLARDNRLVDSSILWHFLTIPTIRGILTSRRKVMMIGIPRLIRPLWELWARPLPLPETGRPQSVDVFRGLRRPTTWKHIRLWYVWL